MDNTRQFANFHARDQALFRPAISSPTTNSMCATIIRWNKIYSKSDGHTQPTGIFLKLKVSDSTTVRFLPAPFCPRPTHLRPYIPCMCRILRFLYDQTCSGHLVLGIFSTSTNFRVVSSSTGKRHRYCHCRP